MQQNINLGDFCLDFEKDLIANQGQNLWKSNLKLYHLGKTCQRGNLLSVVCGLLTQNPPKDYQRIEVAKGERIYLEGVIGVLCILFLLPAGPITKLHMCQSLKMFHGTHLSSCSLKDPVNPGRSRNNQMSGAAEGKKTR